MKQAEVNDSLTTFSDRFASSIKKRNIPKESDTNRSSSTSPSLTTNLRPIQLASPSNRISKQAPKVLVDPHHNLTRHSAAISDLNKTSYSLSKVQKQHKKKLDLSATYDITQKLPDLDWNRQTNLYAKKNPPSLYSSSRNVKSFEHHTVLQEIQSRISCIGNLVDDAMPGTKKDLTRPLKEVFQFCVETESKTYYHVWFKLLNTFEQLIGSLTHKPSKAMNTLENSEVVNDVDALMNRDVDFENPKEETMAMIVKDLSKLWKATTHNITNKETFFALETIWNALVKLLNKSIGAQSARVAKVFESLQETARMERARQKRLMELMVKNYEEKFVRVM